MNDEKNIKATVPPRAPRPSQRPARSSSAEKPQSAVAVKAQLSAAQERTEKTAAAKKPDAPKMSAVQASKTASVQSKKATKELQNRIADSQKGEKKAPTVVKTTQLQTSGQVAAAVKNQPVKAQVKQANSAAAQPKASANVQAKTLQSSPVVKAQSVSAAKPQTVSTVKPQTVSTAKPAVASTSNESKPQARVVRPEPERITSPEMQRRRETVGAHIYEKKDEIKSKTGFFRIILRALCFLLTFVIILFATVFVNLKMICGETSPAAKELLVTTLLETGQMKDIASWFLSAEEIQQIVDGNKMSSFENDIDSSLISIDKTPDANENGEEQKDIEVIEISGRTFFGTLLIIKDPSRVELASIYPWQDEGVPLDKLVNDAGAVAGINGGLYNSTNNSGGRPYGVVVCNGEIQFNEPQQYPGLVIIGFTEDNILEIIPVGDRNQKEIEELVAEKKIRDAVTFQEESSDKNNHFVQLVINGEARDMNGMGSGLNPRTAIGQRADGSVLMLVTDGRGKAGHLGASASDLINIMVEYGAVNAANLDGGSSSCMYYDGEYLMTSVTFYYSNSSWKLPLGFVVK